MKQLNKAFLLNWLLYLASWSPPLAWNNGDGEERCGMFYRDLAGLNINPLVKDESCIMGG